MNLKEVLEEATRRPWAICGNNPELIIAPGEKADHKEYLIADCGDNAAIANRPSQVEAAVNALLQKHAVNNFERMYQALGRAYYSEAFPTMHEEDRLFIKEAFRQAEEAHYE